MKHRTIVSIGLWIFANFIMAANAQTLQGYALLVVSPEGASQLQIIGPANGEFDMQRKALTALEGWYPSALSITSPNGEWVAFLLASLVSTGDPLLVRLVNLDSGETRDIAQGFLAGSEAGFVGTLQNLAWSPDGRFLALNMTLAQESSDLEIFIYSVSDNRLTNLTNDEYSQMHVAWSPESTRFVTRTDDCSQRSVNNYCSYTLDIFDVADNSRLTSFQLPNPALGSVEFAGTACELRWSPEGSAISYVSSCTDGAQVPRGVYLWNIAQDEAAQVTSFTPQATTQGIPDFQGWYVPFWYDSDTLVVSADYMLPNRPENTETLAYNVVEGTRHMLFPEMVTEWALNPVSNVMAARLAQTSAVRLFTLDAADNFTLEQVGESGSLPSGCHLSWSPDGATLAYVTTTSGYCADSIQSIIFVDGTTGEAREYVPEWGDDVWYILPIGWVKQ